MILDYKAIGSRIREVRKSKNMTQEKLSEAINVGYKHLSNIECGNGGVSIEVLASICSVLDISLDYIIFNKPDIRDVKMADDIYKEISSLTRSEREFVMALFQTLKSSRNTCSD